MKFHKMRIKHNPPESYGDCHRAALASLLNLDYEDVPHFMHGLGPNDGVLFNKLQDAFLRSINLASITIPFGNVEDPLSCTIDLVLKWCENASPGTSYLLGGESDRNVGHTIVCGQGKMLHDPHLDNSGLVGPMRDGFWWITYIGVKL